MFILKILSCPNILSDDSKYDYYANVLSILLEREKLKST